ncbi:unnamed protein product [Arabidopsis arenosa]|nr:unnamed protein product [Arabidopsis arenosa]
MVAPSEVFATPPGPSSPDFVKVSSDDELANAEESGTELPIPNFVKAESLRVSTPPIKFATRTWYPGYHGEEGVESSHANLENHVGDQEVPDVTANCETLFANSPRVEKLGVLFPPNETLYEPTLGSSSLDAMIQNMIAVGTLGVEPIRPPEGMPVWNERMRRSADGTVVTELEREDGRRSEPYSVTPFCFTCGQDGHYPRTVLMFVTIIPMLARTLSVSSVVIRVTMQAFVPGSIPRIPVRQVQVQVRPRGSRRETLVLTRIFSKPSTVKSRRGK